MRAVVSVPPPGSKPTTVVMGFAGKFCANAQADAAADLLQQPVAGLVPQRVVHGLEAVDVEQDQRDPALRALGRS